VLFKAVLTVVYIYTIELVLVLNIAEILLAGRLAIINQLFSI